MEITMEGLLKNNSNEMNTYVETFLIEETAELIYDNEQLDKWNKYVEELGLKGQANIVKNEKSPIPFMFVKTNMKNVFETLCPKKVDYTEYNKTPIPLEILDLVALSVRENYFDKIQVWYDDKTPDPVCLGLRYESESDRKNKYDWRMDAYLLGKWGDVKHSFATLTNMATARFKQERANYYHDNMKSAKRGLEDLDSEAFNKFGTTINGHDDDLPF